MNNINVNDQSLILSQVPHPAPFVHVGQVVETTHNLIVLVSSLEADLAAMARRVWQLASASSAHIIFLGLYSNMMQQPSLRRELVTMAALVSDDKVSAEVAVLPGVDWVSAVRSLAREGDMVVCLGEQRISGSHRSLSQVLQAQLDLPLYIISGLYPEAISNPRWISRLAAWGGSLALIAGFFILQVRIVSITQNWFQSALIMSSVALESTLIWVWNNFCG